LRETRGENRRQKTEDRSREQGATKAEDTAKPRKGGHNMVALWQQYKTRFWRKEKKGKCEIKGSNARARVQKGGACKMRGVGP